MSFRFFDVELDKPAESVSTVQNDHNYKAGRTKVYRGKSQKTDANASSTSKNVQGKGRNRRSMNKWQLPRRQHHNKVNESSVIMDAAGIRNAELPDLVDEGDFKTRSAHLQYSSHMDKVSFSRIQSSRARILLPEEAGYIIPDEGEETFRISQDELTDHVDIASASKHFELRLPKFGPYRIDYSRNGRDLLIGGHLGHVAAFDWFTKRLQCEINVMEVVKDVQWLHNETMYAVAQKKWAYIYDIHGTELHCLKMLFNVLRFDYLPYHFLLVSSMASSFLSWLDVSIGKVVASFPTREGPIDVLCHNPYNAIVHTGNAKGMVNLWSPNENTPLVKMLCHRAPVRAISVDNSGRYMATAGADRKMKIWDLRKYEELWTLKSPPISQMHFSQRGLLACAMGPTVRVYKDVCRSAVDKPYLVHRVGEVVTDVRFCPFEDVLGVGHRAGFVSLLIPGAGEPNIDALEANPFQTKSQRTEMEVRALLDKIQPEMITLRPDEINRINSDKEKDDLQHKIEFLYSKQPNAEMLRSNSTSKRSKRKSSKSKQTILANKKREIIRQKKQIRQELVELGVLDAKRANKSR